MRALLDLNLLIALLDQTHPHRVMASSWLRANIKHGWASCASNQNGCIRIMSQAAYTGARTAAQIIERLRGGLNHSAHLFWPDATSIVDPLAADGMRVHSARLVTFDSRIARSAVKGAAARHLVTLV
jgi:predicted nucleic acid-binding protein